MKALKRKEKGKGDKFSRAEIKLIDRYNRLADKSKRLVKRHDELRKKADTYDESTLPGLDHYPPGRRSDKFTGKADDILGRLEGTGTRTGIYDEFNKIKDEAEAILKRMGN